MKLRRRTPHCTHPIVRTEHIGDKLWTSCRHCEEVLNIQQATYDTHGVWIDYATVSALRAGVRRDTQWGS